MPLTDFIHTIERWLQKEDDALEYAPDGMPVDDGVVLVDDRGFVIQHDAELGTDLCPCAHCRAWNGEPAPWDIPLPELEIISYEVSTAGIEGMPFDDAWAELERRINARHGRT